MYLVYFILFHLSIYSERDSGWEVHTGVAWGGRVVCVGVLNVILLLSCKYEYICITIRKTKCMMLTFHCAFFQ